MPLKQIYFLWTSVLFFNLFYLIPKVSVLKLFHMRDIGFIFLFMGLFCILLKPIKVKPKPGIIGLLLIIYFLMIGIHISLSSIHYHQSIIDGMAAARSQFTYLIFFIFLYFLFENRVALEKCLDWLAIIAVATSVISILHYLGVSLHYREKFEDWEVVRSGIRRIFIPGLALIHFSLVWCFSNWIASDKRKTLYGIATVFFWAVLFFHQSRGQIIGLMAATLVIFLIARKIKLFVVFFSIGILAAVILNLTMKEENLIMTTFSSSITDVREGSGTWEGRLHQMDTDFEEFKEHPLIGSGLVTVRISKFETTNKIEYLKMAAKARKEDLGYTHWIKMFGIAGIIWLAMLYFFSFKYCYRLIKTEKKNVSPLVFFCTGYLIFVVVSGVTLNHFMIADKSYLLAVFLAILVFLEKERKRNLKLY
ncbi:O-antigen ligase family protein [Desulfobacter latus]|uniref:O-antigen ligase family protein n=1 Tax=Desulfobacter latus TaxID=2292 RepID=A0A850T636_9BACT|nr:O-antigen ligase family protein [Desulfobacter latus]NWH03707.1 O-antigen ligase family protein [Desulfobacter latus]